MLTRGWAKAIIIKLLIRVASLISQSHSISLPVPFHLLLTLSSKESRKYAFPSAKRKLTSKRDTWPGLAGGGAGLRVALIQGLLYQKPPHYHELGYIS